MLYLLWQKHYIRNNQLIINSETSVILALIFINNFSFSQTVTEVEKMFLKYLPVISEGRELNTNSPIIIIGDVNGDKLLDAVVDYSLMPTMDDNGGGGNAIGELYGVVIYLNKGGKLELALHTTEYGDGKLYAIENGCIKFKTWEYGENDARCCPSIEKEKVLLLKNNKLLDYQKYVLMEMEKIDYIDSEESIFSIIIQKEEFVKTTYYYFGTYGMIIEEFQMEEDLDWLPICTLFFKDNELLLYDDIYELTSTTYFISNGNIITSNSDVPQGIYKEKSLIEIKKQIKDYQQKYKYYSKTNF